MYRLILSCLTALCVLTNAATAGQSVITPERLTGPLSFKAGANEYTVPGLYAPPTATETLASWLGKPLPARTGKPDRWGRITLQTPATLALLQAGLAQLQPLTDAPDAAETAAEQEAIANQRGLWALDCCRRLTAETAATGLNSWRVVSGLVKSTTSRRDVTYINFGTDWRSDFSIIIPARLAKQLHPENWQGRTIEVRGYLSWRFGPSITLSHAAQIRLPEAPTP